MIVAAFVRITDTVLRLGHRLHAGGLRWPVDESGVESPCPDLELRTVDDEFVTVATYDRTTDAHIALGRLAAEGIAARLFDEQMVQMDWLYAIALGGIKLCVAQRDAASARRVLATDYSHELDGVDLGKPEN
ncbi:MAG TPA: hypothetical protein VFM15_02770 [Gammaproteobacteria bacterium]|nr:hypothetical protein [Gammaproteobacteria bacterium]